MTQKRQPKGEFKVIPQTYRNESNYGFVFSDDINVWIKGRRMVSNKKSRAKRARK
jgi:hypothetical protein